MFILTIIDPKEETNMAEERDAYVQKLKAK